MNSIMNSIKEYSNLIKEIPTGRQSSKIKRSLWEKILSDEKLKNEIFGNNDEIELSRNDVISEENEAKKIVKVLMWGYPSGGRGNNINEVLKEIDGLKEIFEKKSKNITKEDSFILFEQFSNIKGLGISTWSKLLFFFGISIESNKCQIFDTKVVESLNRTQFYEFKKKGKWKHNDQDYYEYIELVNRLSGDMGVQPEQIEVFLFYFNLYYKLV